MSFTDFYGPTDESRSHAILTRCLDLGITHLDTANAYGLGKSENRIDSFLAKQGKQTSHLFQIATKAGITRDADGKRCTDNSSEHLKSALDESLRRLGVDHIELFYVHRRDPNRPIEEVAETLTELVKSGKARQVGFSEIAPTQLALAQEIMPVGAVQSEYSLATRSPEMDLLQRTAELRSTLVAFSPVGRALLTDTPLDYDTCQTLDFMKLSPQFLQPNHGRNIAATVPFRGLAAEMGMRTSSLAIAWLLHQGDHILPIPGKRELGSLSPCRPGCLLILYQHPFGLAFAVDAKHNSLGDLVTGRRAVHLFQWHSEDLSSGEGLIRLALLRNDGFTFQYINKLFTRMSKYYSGNQPDQSSRSNQAAQVSEQYSADY